MTIPGSPCPACAGTGVIDTGNNEVPCRCPAGNDALFNVATASGVVQVTGRELKVMSRLAAVEQDLPWLAPTGIYDTSGPAEDAEFLVHSSVGAIRFQVGLVRRADGSVETGIHTGRPRYWVRCVDCALLIHEATTSATIRVLDHVMDCHETPEEAVGG